jgi:hypothetical protein
MSDSKTVDISETNMAIRTDQSLEKKNQPFTEPEQSGRQRRTQRVHIAMPVIVRGKNFKETTNTVTVNQHGCLLLLKSKVLGGETLSLINPNTTEELPGKVVALGRVENGLTHVAVQFTEHSPLFWRISFPPDDWLSSDERKRTANGERKRAANGGR